MSRPTAKAFADPDAVRTFPMVRFETVDVGEATVSHCTFEPGWRWSTGIGPLMHVDSCPIRHVGYSVSGTIRVVMDDGETIDVGPDVAFDVPPGHDKWVVGDEPWVAIEWGASGRAMSEAIQEETERSLATIVFTDIVGSTNKVEALGDAAWRDLLTTHHVRLREQLNIYRGREINTTGDGLLIVFDSPTRALRCAAAMVRSSAASGFEIRVGVHTGEVDLVGDDVRGIAVHLAARLLTQAGPGEVVVSATTAALAEGSGFTLEDGGTHELKGFSGPRRLFRLVDPASPRHDSSNAV